MTTRSQYQRNASRRSQHQMSSDNDGQEVLQFNPLRRLEFETIELVRSIEAREHRMQQDKRQVLLNIYKIYTEHFSELEEKHQRDLALYIEEVIQVQDRKTALSDAKIIEMIQTHGSAGLLEMDVRGMLYSLRRIAYLKDPADPLRAHQKQQELLDQLDSISREELELSLRIFREQTKLRNHGSQQKSSEKSWQQKIDRKNGRIVLSQIPAKRLDKLNRLLLQMNDEILDEMLGMIERNHPKRVLN